MEFDFDKAAGKAKARRVAGAKARKRRERAEPETDYQERAVHEESRRKLATCGDYWACICFRTASERTEFCELTGFSPVTFGDRAADLLAKIMPEVNRRSRPLEVRGAIRYPYTFKDIKYTYNLEQDCKLEAAALVEAIRSRKDLPSYCAATDSPYYISLVCRDDEDRESLYDRFGLWHFGNKYLDGSAWLARLRASAPSSQDGDLQ